jgi:hypothetical protein
MGILAAAIANYSMYRGDERACPADFMPSHRSKLERELSEEELAAQIHMTVLQANKAFGV